MLNKLTKEQMKFRTDLEKNRMKRYYITLPIATVLIFLAIMAMWSVGDTSKVSFQCSINDIEYRDVRPYPCWDSDDYNTSAYCPLPHNIDCKGNLENLGTIAGSMISEMFS